MVALLVLSLPSVPLPGVPIGVERATCVFVVLFILERDGMRQNGVRCGGMKWDGMIYYVLLWDGMGWMGYDVMLWDGVG